MTNPCNEKENIQKVKADVSELKKNHAESANKLDTVIKNQEKHSEDFREAMNKIVEILVENTRHTEAIVQLKKETDLLFAKDRSIGEKVERLEKHAAICDGAEILEKVKNLNIWMLQENGIRRFIPSIITVATGLAALYVFFTQHIPQIP